MPAHPNPAPVNIGTPMDVCLLDDEFDIFEITRPYDKHSGIGHDTLLCDDNSAEYNQ